MHRNMFGFIAFDFILRLFRTAPAHVPFVFGILRVLFLNHSRYLAGFRIPPDMVTDVKRLARVSRSFENCSY